MMRVCIDPLVFKQALDGTASLAIVAMLVLRLFLFKTTVFVQCGLCNRQISNRPFHAQWTLPIDVPDGQLVRDGQLWSKYTKFQYGHLSHTTISSTLVVPLNSDDHIFSFN